MSISSGVVSGIDQLLSLLNNPEQLRATLEELKAAAKNAEDMIALAAPASEIPVLREKLRAEAEGIVARENKARLLCESLAETAKIAASERLATAQREAERIVDEASLRLADARKTLEKAAATRSEADSALAQAQTAQAKADDQSTEAKKQLVECAQMKQAVGAEKDRIRKLADTLQASI